MHPPPTATATTHPSAVGLPRFPPLHKLPREVWSTILHLTSDLAVSIAIEHLLLRLPPRFLLHPTAFYRHLDPTALVLDARRKRRHPWHAHPITSFPASKAIVDAIVPILIVPPDAACSRGTLQLVWMARYFHRGITHRLVEAAAAANRIDVLSMLHFHGVDRFLASTADAAVAAGCKAAMVFLIRRTGSRGCHWKTALERAAEGGHLEVVELLVEETGGKGWEEALVAAARGGHEAVFKRLLEVGKLDKPALEAGADAGEPHDSKDDTPTLVDRAAHAALSHLPILRHLHETLHHPVPTDLSTPISHGHLPILRYIFATAPSSLAAPPPASEIASLLETGNLPAVEFLHAACPALADVWPQCAMPCVRSRKPGVVRFMFGRYPVLEFFKEFLMLEAVRGVASAAEANEGGEAVEVVKILLELWGTACLSANVLRAAVESGNLDLVTHLHTVLPAPSTGPSPPAWTPAHLARAVSLGHAPISVFLHDVAGVRLPVGPPSPSLCFAGTAPSRGYLAALAHLRARGYTLPTPAVHNALWVAAGLDAVEDLRAFGEMLEAPLGAELVQRVVAAAVWRGCGRALKYVCTEMMEEGMAPPAACVAAAAGRGHVEAALEEAAAGGWVDCVRVLMEPGGVGAVPGVSRRAVEMAVRGNHVEVLAWLLRKGRRELREVSAEDKKEWFKLASSVDVVRILVEETGVEWEKVREGWAGGRGVDVGEYLDRLAWKKSAREE
ncbi:hypothetical protein HDU96_006670 [Phlyctochytrium bullatum]|nr:hypothetical protein HDU96_006670 [Phlyctochytrium bullatum]